MKKWVKILLILCLVILTALVSCGVTLYLVSMPDSSVETGSVTAKMDEIGSYLEAYFIDEYDPAVLETAAADGAAAAMVEATGDRWSYYISASDMAAYNESFYNEYVGIGVTVQMQEDGVAITSVTKGGPAYEAGLLVGDVITKVDGKSTVMLGLDGTVERVRGEAGTELRITFLRDGVSTDLTLVRAAIVSDVAEGRMLDGNIGYITIANFDHHCAEQTLACMEELLEQGAEALLFDVRFNGGGLKDEMVKILDALLPEGELFRSVDYAGEEEVDLSDAACINLPMAVIVNEDSYSAAEFFAAALQEYEAAEVVGMKTVGKGNFQYTLALSDGSAVALSVGKYFTPKGISLTDVGVTPDVEMDLTYEDYEALYYGVLEEAEDEQLQAAIQLLLTKIS